MKHFSSLKVREKRKVNERSMKKANVSTGFLNKFVLTLTSIKNIIKNSKNEIF
jgi:hypothetical protein